MSQIPPEPVVVKLGLDAADFEAGLAELTSLLRSAPESLLEKLLGLGDIVGELFCIRPDRRATPSAGEVVVSLEPTDLFRRLVLALRAGDFENDVFDECREPATHSSISVVGLDNPNEEPTPAESQGSVGARARNSHPESVVGPADRQTVVAAASSPDTAAAVTSSPREVSSAAAPGMAHPDFESRAKATKGKAGMAGAESDPVRRSTAGTGLRVGEASADLPTTSELMDVTGGESAATNSDAIGIPSFLKRNPDNSFASSA